MVPQNPELPYDPAVPFLNMDLKELKAGTQTHMYMNVPRSIIDKEPTDEKTQISVDG